MLKILMIFVLLQKCYFKDNIFTRKRDFGSKNILLLSIYHFIVQTCQLIFLIDPKADMFVVGLGGWYDWPNYGKHLKYIFL